LADQQNIIFAILGEQDDRLIRHTV
jgi:hypothetical protein